MNPGLFPEVKMRVVTLTWVCLSLAAGCTNTSTPSSRTDAGTRDGADTASLRTRTDAVGAAGGDLLRHSLAVPTGDRATSAVLIEKLAPREARLNRPYDYRIRVTNLTDAPLADVVVREKAADGFTISRSDPAVKDAAGWHTYAVGELAPSASRVIEISGVPTAEGKLATCLAVDYHPTLCAVADVVNPVVKLTKEGPAEADLCEGIRYRYVVSNTGTGTERDVTIEDVLPEGVTTEDGKRTVTLRVGDLPQSTSKEVTVRVKPAHTGQYTSTAVARSPGSPDVRSQEVTTVVRQPALEVHVTGPRTEYLNKTVTYTITVKNTGDAAARRTTLGLDAADHGTVASVMVNGGDNPAGEARVASAYRREGADLDAIAPGQTKTVTATIRATQPGPMRLRAVAVAGCVPPVTETIETAIRTLPALRLEVVDLDDPIRVGDQVTYRVTVKNQGTGPDANVAITATLPPELTFTSADGPANAAAAKAEGQTVRFEPVPTLAAGDQAVWTVKARATKPGDVRMRVQLKSDSLTEPAGESEPTRLY
jgi:uncharacterized repeat protein (TIGR01451 family)